MYKTTAPEFTFHGIVGDGPTKMKLIVAATIYLGDGSEEYGPNSPFMIDSPDGIGFDVGTDPQKTNRIGTALKNKMSAMETARIAALTPPVDPYAFAKAFAGKTYNMALQQVNDPKDPNAVGP